jgi:sulfate transport system permease protein
MSTRRILPGFGLSLGYTIFYLSLLVLIPLGGLIFKSFDLGWDRFLAVVTGKRVLAAYWLSFYTAITAAGINTVIGLIVAWVLVRYRFPGRALLDAVVDLPFALPTAVAGIALTTLYAPTGWLGGFLESHGVQVINSATGITLALVFIGFPFVVRTVQPVLEELEPEIEDAAHSLGAGRWQLFLRVILPTLAPALLTGFTLAFARAIGEYGSVIFIAGNLPMKTEIAPLLIMAKLDQFDYTGAAAIALVLLAISFAMLLLLNWLQGLQQRAKER